MANPLRKTTCNVCGKEFTEITGTHLKTHGMTRGEYITKFGPQGVQGADVKIITHSDAFPAVDTYIIDRCHRIQKYMK